MSGALGSASLAATRRLPAWCKPRLAQFDQYKPRPLTVPKTYVVEEIPSNAPAISVITPSLNQGRYIEQALSSVLDQGYPNLEYVVQDGGSTDGTAQILERYGPRITSWSTQPDRGQADAINRAFAKTSGEILAFLNADDILLPGALAYVGRFFAEHPDVDVVYGHRIVVDDRGQEVGRWVLPPHDDRSLRWVDYVPQETAFWRRRIWERSGASVSEEYELVFDWELFLRFLDAGARFARLPRFVAAVRSHPGQKSQRYLQGGEIECRTLRAAHLGREPSDGEIAAAIRGYQLKQLAWHAAFRARLIRP